METNFEYIAFTYSSITSSLSAIARSRASLRAIRNFSSRPSVAPEVHDSWISGGSQRPYFGPEIRSSRRSVDSVTHSGPGSSRLPIGLGR